MHSLLDPAVQYAYAGAPGQYFIVNGQYQPAITVQPGELVRLRLINGGEASAWAWPARALALGLGSGRRLEPCAWVCQ